MTTTLFALPAGHKKEKEPASVPIAAGFGCVRRLRSTGSCNGSIYDSTHGSIRADARSSTLGGTAGER